MTKNTLFDDLVSDNFVSGNGRSAMDGDNLYSHNPLTDFDSFLLAMGEDKANHSANYGYDDEDYDDNDDGYNMTDLHTEEYNQYDVDDNDEYEEETLDEGEDSEDEEETDTDDDSSSSTKDAGEEGTTHFEVEDWEASFKLPDGTELSAKDLYEFKEFNKIKEDFEQRAEIVRQRESLMSEDLNVSKASIEVMRHQLAEVSKYRPLTDMEMMQYQVLSQMDNYFDAVKANFQSTYKKQIEEFAHKQSEELSNNVDQCFNMFPEFDKELKTITHYLKGKGIENPEQLYKQTGYDPKIMSILYDAAAKERVKMKGSNRSALVMTTPKVKSIQGMTGKGKNPLSVNGGNQYMGISSHQMDSYKSFLNAMDL